MRDPDALTRVSEYVPQIIEFIKKIEKRGTAQPYLRSTASSHALLWLCVARRHCIQRWWFGVL